LALADDRERSDASFVDGEEPLIVFEEDLHFIRLSSALSSSLIAAFTLFDLITSARMASGERLVERGTCFAS